MGVAFVLLSLVVFFHGCCIFVLLSLGVLFHECCICLAFVFHGRCFCLVHYFVATASSVLLCLLYFSRALLLSCFVLCFCAWALLHVAFFHCCCVMLLCIFPWLGFALCLGRCFVLLVFVGVALSGGCCISVVALSCIFYFGVPPSRIVSRGHSCAGERVFCRRCCFALHSNFFYLSSRCLWSCTDKSLRALTAASTLHVETRKNTRHLIPLEEGYCWQQAEQ